MPGRLSPTWNGDITDYVRCKFIMKVYRSENLIENASKLGNYIVSQLSGMNKFMNVRGRGFLIAFDFENSDESEMETRIDSDYIIKYSLRKKSNNNEHPKTWYLTDY